MTRSLLGSDWSSARGSWRCPIAGTLLQLLREREREREVGPNTRLLPRLPRTRLWLWFHVACLGELQQGLCPGPGCSSAFPPQDVIAGL